MTRDSLIEVSYSIGDKAYNTFFQTQDGILHLTPESRIAATLLPSMKQGEPITEGQPVDPQFLTSLDRIRYTLDLGQFIFKSSSESR